MPDWDSPPDQTSSLNSFSRAERKSTNYGLQKPSPIDQTPNEVLTLIFELACSENLLEDPWPIDLSSPVIAYLPSLAISAVCGRWRLLGLALPGLWSRLKLEIMEGPTASDGFMATLQLYLERSANALLFLKVNVRYTDERPDPGNPPALNLLLQHTSRWKTFQCRTSITMSKTPLFLPVLEFLAVKWANFGGDAAEAYHCFRAAPLLQALRIDASADIEEGLLPMLPQHQLTTLIMDHHFVPYPSLCMVVGRLHNLTTLELFVRAVDLQPRFLFILLARLRSFTLLLEHYSSDNDPRVFDWFRIFTFPSLDKLIISRTLYGGKLNWSARAFSEFLSRSSCTLTYLSISSIAISDLDFIAALQLLPSLTKLGFDDYHVEEKKMQSRSERFYSFGVTNPITSVFLSKLTIRDSNSDPGLILVPLLQSLTIKLEGTSFDDASFVEMVLSRWLPDRSYTGAIGVASLRSLVLRLHERVVDEDIYLPLFELDKVGMRWGREVKEEENLRPLGNLERMGMRVVITGKEYSDREFEQWVSEN